MAVAMAQAEYECRPRKRQRLGWDQGPAQEPFFSWAAFNLASLRCAQISYQIQMSTEIAKLNPPWREDDKDGHFVSEIGESITPRYEIISKMGEGTFGRVLECWDREAQENLAIKVIRSAQKHRDAAMIEIDVLNLLKLHDPSGLRRCVQLRNSFDYRNHVCMVFEKLGPSLYDFLKRNSFRPFSVDVVRDMGRQLLESVAYMHQLGLVHTDLKPENILLVSGELAKESDSRLKRAPKSSDIKLIDFGNATYGSLHQSSVVSTRHYRAPEVILGFGWSHSCDLWSVGCILIELVTGKTLFQTHENLEHLAMMERALGPIPANIIKRADCVKYFRNGKLYWPEGSHSRESVRAVKKLSSLKSLVGEHMSKSAGLSDFVDLLQGLLEYDPSTRMTAKEALRHRFFTQTKNGR